MYRTGTQKNPAPIIQIAINDILALRTARNIHLISAGCNKVPFDHCVGKLEGEGELTLSLGGISLTK